MASVLIQFSVPSLDPNGTRAEEMRITTLNGKTLTTVSTSSRHTQKKQRRDPPPLQSSKQFQSRSQGYVT
jgi:hypothetical protein